MLVGLPEWIVSNILHPQGCAPWLVGSSIAQIVVHPATSRHSERGGDFCLWLETGSLKEKKNKVLDA